jgi:hypothetical protein
MYSYLLGKLRGVALLGALDRPVGGFSCMKYAMGYLAHAEVSCSSSSESGFVAGVVAADLATQTCQIRPLPTGAWACFCVLNARGDQGI